MQIGLDGLSKEQVAINRIRQYEPPEGYNLRFSGGKDSTCLYHLVVKAGVKFDAHYSVTGIDPPELVRHIKQHYPDVHFEMPKMSIWRYIEKKGLPTRVNRWCCQKLKETGGEGRLVLTGIRHEESAKRRSRPMYQELKTKRMLHPIYDWTLLDVWNFIDSNKHPYCSLYDTYSDRLGCVMCPMAGEAERRRAKERYPKIYEAWHRACIRYFDANRHRLEQTKGLLQSGEAMWQWWLSGMSVKNFIKQNQTRFKELEEGEQ
jgi:phosphoadenosine phosphosulfate reductase